MEPQSPTVEFVHFTHKSCFTFLPCTTMVHSQDHTTRHFKSSTLHEITLCGFTPVQKVEHINVHTPGCPRLSHSTANGDPLLSESSLLCQALPIISLVVVLFCRVTWSKNRSLDLQQEQTTNPPALARALNCNPSC